MSGDGLVLCCLVREMEHEMSGIVLVYAPRHNLLPAILANHTYLGRGQFGTDFCILDGIRAAEKLVYVESKGIHRSDE